MPLIAKAPKRTLHPMGSYGGEITGITVQPPSDRFPDSMERICFEFTTNEIDDEGKRLKVFLSANYLLTSRSNLTKHVGAIRGFPLTREEMETGYDLEQLLGSKVSLIISHKVSELGDTYAKVDAVVKSAEQDVEEDENADPPF